MEGTLFLAFSDDLVIQQVVQEDQRILVCVQSTHFPSSCPLCHHPSDRIHSRYQRKMADLPCAGRMILLKLSVRRFFCRNPACQRKIFNERLPDLTQPWAQMTNRLREALQKLAFATCGEAGARLVPQLGMRGSPSTLLRTQKAALLPAPAPFTKIGLDDFAFRRGRTYGPLIVNLHTHALIESLADRTATTVSAWLASYPQIEVISRDRGADYASAAPLGAPQALQVCDRWHLLKNLSEYMYTFLARMRSQIRKASQKQTQLSEAGEVSKLRAIATTTRSAMRSERLTKKTALEEAKEAKQSQRLDRYQQMLRFRSQGLSLPQIASRLGVTGRTLQNWLAHGIEPRTRRRRPSSMDQYASYLRRRWEEGCQIGEALYQQVRAQGYTGSINAVYRYLKRWHSMPLPKRLLAPKQPEGKWRMGTKAPLPGPFDACQAKQAVWLYFRAQNELTEEEQKQLAFLQNVHPLLKTAYCLTQQFVNMVRERKGDQLDIWLEQVGASKIPELVRFGRGVILDKAAVKAALLLPYSNGVVEGSVHRLKLIKRQGYGRASFPLLRQRVLYQAR
jgi:transposase